VFSLSLWHCVHVARARSYNQERWRCCCYLPSGTCLRC